MSPLVLSTGRAHAVVRVFQTRDYDMILSKYAQEGTREWVDEFTGDGVGGGSMSWDYAAAVGIHPDGFVVVCGQTMTPENDYDILVRAIAP